MELFRAGRGSRTNASTHRSSSKVGAVQFTLIFFDASRAEKTFRQRNSSRDCRGIIGLAAGLFLGFALGAILAKVMHISSFEGGAGYFAVAIAILVTVLVAPVAVLLTLYWRGIRGIWLFIGLVTVCVSMFAIGASGLGIWYAAQPHVLNLNGPTPLLEFEVKPPEGQSLENLANVEAQLDTDRNSMPGTWRTEAPANSGVRAGYVEIYFRTSRRLFVLKFPGHEDRIFNVHLPANPMNSKYRSWSEWQKPDFVAKADQQPTRFSGGNGYQIRYRVDYQDR